MQKATLSDRSSSVATAAIRHPSRRRRSLGVLHLGQHPGADPDVDQGAHGLNVALAE